MVGAGPSGGDLARRLALQGLDVVLVDRLADLYAPDETRLWLYARHPLLGGERPIDLIHDGRTERVLGVIESLADGTYT